MATSHEIWRPTGSNIRGLLKSTPTATGDPESPLSDYPDHLPDCARHSIPRPGEKALPPPALASLLQRTPMTTPQARPADGAIPLSTPRRSTRARRPPTRFYPPASTVSKRSNPRVSATARKSSTASAEIKSLIVRLSYEKPAVSAASQTSTKRKHAVLESMPSEKEGSAPQRRLMEIPGSILGGVQETRLSFSSIDRTVDEHTSSEQRQAEADESSTVPNQFITNHHDSLNGHEQQPSSADASSSKYSPEIFTPSAVKDPELIALATKLARNHRTDTGQLEPAAQPQVWADTRQELCETLPYYRSYRSGSYCTGGFARAFMFSTDAHHRDYMDASVVISRAGGGMSKDQASGKRKLDKNQTEGSQVYSLRNSMKDFNPVVVITSNTNPKMASKPPHLYCVLDYFKPTHIWSEKSGGKIFIRYRFEKLNAKNSSWWQPKDTEELAMPGSLPSPMEQTCASCKQDSQQIYLQGWMCVNTTCDAFWKIPQCLGDPIEPQEDSLVYDPRFLKQKAVKWPNEDVVYPLIPSHVTGAGSSISGEDFSLSQWVGRVCSMCGRCNARLSWSRWGCENPGCNFEEDVTHTVIPASATREPYFPLSTTYTLSRDTHLGLVYTSVTFANNYRINQYNIPGIEGFVVHMIANQTVVEEPDGPDAMFEELQKNDIGLQRRPLGGGGDEAYTRHFAVNYGMPYKFIAATASISFEGAARPILDTRSRLNWAAKSVLAQQAGTSIDEFATTWKQNEFNEVLALGYFEKQRISYHDDGEYGLGPTIATLSLGAPGTMRLRMKHRYHNGISKAGIYDNSPPLPGSVKYEERLAMYPSLQELKQRDKKAYERRVQELIKSWNLKSNMTARDAITMTLGHGDIVIMHGADIQKYYEHSVDHAGKLRFALTCRYIDPRSLKPEDQPKYDVAPDKDHYDGAKLPGPEMI